MISQRAMGIGGPARPWVQRHRGANRLEQFPLAVWSKLVSRHARNVSRDLMGYGDPMGYGPFREVIAEYLRAFRAVKCELAQIMVTTSPQQALQIAALALLDAKDSAWIEEPAYPGTHQALQAAGARAVPVPVDAEGLNIEYGIQQEGCARVAIVTPSHQFPMGVSMSSMRRLELLSWAREHGGWIIEDDCNSEYDLRGTPVSSLQGLDVDGRVIYVGTLTKAVFPALRLGFIVIPKDLIRSFLDIRNATDTFATSVLYQMAMTDFIREGHFSRHMSRMREVQIETRNALAAAIIAQTAGLLEVVDDEADMQLVTLLPPGLDDVDVAAKLPKLSAAVYALSECYVSRPPRGGLVIGYANLNLEDIPAMLAALKTAIHTSIPKH
jgi:GntR family transcriptional regulator/MocR family aminotransferase